MDESNAWSCLARSRTETPAEHWPLNMWRNRRRSVGSHFAGPKFRRGFKLQFEGLEQRMLMAVTVNTLLDEVDGSILDGDVSLRDAIALGTPGEVIDFSVQGTIQLTLGQLFVDRRLSIEGPGSTLLTIDASGSDPTPDVLNGDGSRVLLISLAGSSGDVAVSGVSLTGGDVGSGGGGLHSSVAGVVTLSDVVVFSNGGGGISSDSPTNSGELMLVNCRFERNSTSSSGGGISVDGLRTTIVETIVQENTATGSGAGVFVRSAGLAVSDSSISDNDSGSDGGGILTVNGSVAISDSTISNNSAGRLGGGIFVSAAGGTSTIENSTISGNSAVLNGGGIFLVRQSGGAVPTMVLEHSTVTRNSGHGIANSSSFIRVGSSIVSGNNGDDIVQANAPNGFQSLGFNVVGDGSGASNFSNHDMTNVMDPHLGPLQDNGGATATHALMLDSPALDMGNPAFTSPPEFDQRGAPYLRVSGGRVDVGAFEVQAAAINGDFNDDGLWNCADIDALVAQVVSGNNLPAFDLTGDGLVNLFDRDAWFAESGEINLGPGRVYRLGDANLDGVVDGSDFNLWNSNKFSVTPAWCSGDFNADGAIDGSDFNIWNANKFTSSDFAGADARLAREDTLEKQAPLDGLLARWTTQGLDLSSEFRQTAVSAVVIHGGQFGSHNDRVEAARFLGDATRGARTDAHLPSLSRGKPARGFGHRIRRPFLE